MSRRSTVAHPRSMPTHLAGWTIPNRLTSYEGLLASENADTDGMTPVEAWTEFERVKCAAVAATGKGYVVPGAGPYAPLQPLEPYLQERLRLLRWKMKAAS